MSYEIPRPGKLLYTVHSEGSSNNSPPTTSEMGVKVSQKITKLQQEKDALKIQVELLQMQTQEFNTLRDINVTLRSQLNELNQELQATIQRVNDYTRIKANTLIKIIGKIAGLQISIEKTLQEYKTSSNKESKKSRYRMHSTIIF